MKLSCEKNELQKAVQIVARGVSTRTTLPILTGIMIAAGKDKIELMSTDLEISMRMQIGSKVGEEGKVVLPAKLFGDIVRSLDADSVEIVSEGYDATIRSGKGNFKIRTFPVEDFPKIPDLSDGGLSINKEVINEMILQVSRAASRDETRPVLTGVLVDVIENQIKMVATDSYRLGIRDEKIVSPNKEKFRTIVPVRALLELSRVIPLVGEEEISIIPQENQIIFNIDGISIISRLIEGQFPNYQQLLPESYQIELSIEREALLNTVKRVSILAQNNLPIKIMFEKKNLIVTSDTQGVGQAEEKIDIDFDGEPFEVAFNPGYLMDGLNSSSQKTIAMKFVSPVKPAVITAEKEEKFVYLLMPVRIA